MTWGEDLKAEVLLRSNNKDKMMRKNSGEKVGFFVCVCLGGRRRKRQTERQVVMRTENVRGSSWE